MSIFKRDQRLRFKITFEWLIIKDCPDHFKQKPCYLRYIRGDNDLKTNKIILDNHGQAVINTTFEIKTILNFDD